MDLSISKNLETCVSKMLFPSVSDQLHLIVICWPVSLVINEKTGLPRKYGGKPTGPSRFQKNQVLLSPTKNISVHWFTTEQSFTEYLLHTRHHWAKSSWASQVHRIMEKADCNQIIRQINDYFQTVIRTMKAPWPCVTGRSARAPKRCEIKSEREINHFLEDLEEKNSWAWNSMDFHLENFNHWQIKLLTQKWR